MNVQNNTALASGTVPVAAGSVVGHNRPPVELPKLTEAEKEAISKAMSALTDKLASVVDDTVNGIILTIEQAKKDYQDGPFAILGWARENIPAETLALFPTPGSETGDRPDKYEELYFRDGKKKFRKTSFYQRWFLQSFPEGKRIAAALAHVALAKDANANPASIPEDIRKMNPVDLDAYRSDLTAMQNAGVRAVRDAFALLKQFEAINDLPKVEADALLDGNGNVQKIAKPIKVWSTENPDVEWQLYSISGFMQFDPAKAAELGGTFDALKLTAKREQSQDGGNGTGDKPVSINTTETLVARLTDIHEFIVNKVQPNPELYGLFLKHHIAVPGADDFIETLDDIAAFCRRVLSIPTVAARLEAISRRPDKTAVNQ